MNKVLIDNSPLISGHAGRGIGTYVQGLKQGFKLAETDLQIIFGSPKTGSADLVHYPYFDLFWPTLPLRKKTKVIVTIHDLIPLKYPKFFPVGIRGWFNWKLQQTSLKSVDHVITDSQASKKDITKFTKYPANQISVIYLGAGEKFKPQKTDVKKEFKKKHQLDKKLIGYVGDINYNKNIPALIRAVGQVTSCHLAIVTRADIASNIPESIAIRQAINDSGIGQRLHFIPVDSANELAVFYSVLDWYIQPSIDEGFGLPVLEAMQTGVPALVAQAGSLPEVAGKAGLYFDPHNLDDMVQMIETALLMTPAQRQKYIRLGLEQAKKFSWNQAAQELIAVYQNILSK